ncbi:MAG: ABC transporter permease [Patescibacteria group bacterium]
MKLDLLVRTSASALYANKTRSGLTILGIVIGITAIILIFSLGAGAERLILSQLSGFGAELVVVRPGKQPQGPSDLAQTLFADSLKERDFAALKQKSNVPDLTDIAPVVIVPGSVSYAGETYRPTIFGWSADFMGSMFNIEPVVGDYFTEADIRNKASVAVIGDKVKRELFAGSDAVGKSIKIKNRNFRVVAVLPPKGQTSFFNVDEVVLLPYSTAQTYLLGIDYYHEIMFRATDGDAVPRMVADVTTTLRELHNVKDPAKDDFYVTTAEGVVAQVTTILSAMTAFLTSVVAISLVVGGIGVMNIMLVSVTERTREIGLRKAVGATDANILRQFLFEAVILTGLGGLIGILLGLALSYLASLAIGAALGVAWEFSFPLLGLILGVGVSAGVGLLFGIYPARKAARQDPIEALRYE